MINYLSTDNITLTNEQLTVLNASPNKIITGCAGSGKTLLVVNLAQIKAHKGKTVCIIIFTKALRTYIEDLLSRNNTDNITVMYEREWMYDRKWEQSKYDYYIIDEFQDFSLDQIKSFTKNARIGSYIFGDEEQRIYQDSFNKTCTAKTIDIIEQLNFDLIQLTQNFRVPTSIVDFINSIYTDKRDSKSFPSWLEKWTIYYSTKNIYGYRDEAEKPLVIRFLNYLKEMEWISLFLQTNSQYSNIGILLRRNSINEVTTLNHKDNLIKITIPGVIEFKDYLLKQGIECGYKYKGDDYLNFNSNKSINILTTHSAKGIEFDCVIIPFCNWFNTGLGGNIPYIAYTRSRNKLIITYSFAMAQEITRANKCTYEVL